MKKRRIFVVFTILLILTISIYTITYVSKHDFEISVNQEIKLDSGSKINFDVSNIGFDQAASAGDADGTIFNRYTVTYTSDVYLKGTIVYQVNGTTETERFFLEPKKAYTFSSFINGYIDNVSASTSGITSLTFENISDNSGTFSISSFKLVQYPGVSGIVNWITNDYGNGFNPNNSIYTDQQTMFIANDNITLGLSLRYGGSINYLSGDNDIFSSAYANINLVNNRDNGRFIQQSYYGNQTYSGNGSAYAFGDDCNSIAGLYNPIQGGFAVYDDNNSSTDNTKCGWEEGVEYNSKIVDIGISVEYDENNEIYSKRVVIVTQPSLWEVSNATYRADYMDVYYRGYKTESYMTSDYTLYGTYVDVNNYFIDFTTNMSDAEKDWTEQSARSESPAVYTISALDELYAMNMPNDTEKQYSYQESDNTLAIRNFINDEVQRDDGTYDSAIYSFWGGFYDTNSNGITEGIGIYRPGYNRENHEYLHGFVSSNELSKNSTADSTNFITHILHLYNGNIGQFKKFSYDYVITLGKINDKLEDEENDGTLNRIMWQYRYDHSYFLTIDPNGGTVAGSTEPIIKGYDSNGVEDEKHKLLEYWANLYAIATSQKAGYDFNGYYTMKNGGEQVYNSDGLAVDGTYWRVYPEEYKTTYAVEERYQYVGKKDLTVYAQYTPSTYTITYNLDGGTVTGNPTTYTIESQAITLNNPTKTGYTFIGWTGTGLSTTTKTVTIPKGSTGNRSYTANFVKDSTITVNHYLEGTTNKLKTSETITKKYQETYTTSAASDLLTNYSLVSTPTNASGTANGNDITVTYYYKLKTATITVHHYIKGTTDKLADDVVTTQKYTTTYSTKAASVDSNYELVETPSNASGTVNGDITVTYYYQLKKGTITVHHYIKGSTTKLADDVVTTQNYTTEYKTKAATVDSNYELVSTPSNASGTVSGNVTVTYYYQLKKGTITVHHYIENTTTKLADDVVTIQEYTTTYTTTPATVNKNYELVKTPSNANGTVNGDITVIYYYKLKTATLTVNHYIEGTTTKLSKTTTQSLNWGDEYTTSRASDISTNYELVSTPSNANGIIAGDVIVNYYYSLKEATLTVHHYIEGTTTELSKTTTKGVNWGDKYETSPASDINTNYELVSTPSNASGTIAGNTTVIYYYKLKTATITVHHYIKGTTDKLADDVVTTQKYTTTYSTKAASVDSNYELVETPSNASGTVSGNVTVTYYYQLKKGTITVHHYIENSTTKLADDVVITKDYTTKYTTTPATVDSNYELVNTPSNATGTVTGNTTVIYYYKLKTATITVHHYIKGTTNKLADDVVTTQKYTTTYSTKAASVDSNYELVETPSNATGTVSGNVTVTYYYQLKTATLTVNHYVQGTSTKLSDTVTKTMNWGEEYTTSVATDISANYELVSTPSNSSGTIAGDVTVNYYYKLKEGTLTIHYYVKGTTTKLSNSITKSVHRGDKYETSPATDINENYELVSTPSNATGTISANETIVIYYYQLKTATLTVNHYIEGTTTKLSDTVTKNMNWGETYITSKATDINDNYELVETPSNATGTIKGNVTVNYYYKLKESRLIVNYYIEGTTTKLADSINKDLKWGDKYETSPSNQISNNYELVSTPDNATGTIKDNTVIVNYYYRLKEAKLTVHHYIEGTTTKLTDSETSTIYWGDQYTTEQSSKVSSNYEIVSVPSNATGTVSGDVTVIYYYRLKTATITVYHYIEGTTTRLADSESFTKKYTEEYITNPSTDIDPNYEVVSTPNNASGTVSGNVTVIYYYKLKTATLTVHHYIEGTTTSLAADEISTVTYTHTYKTSPSTSISSNYELASTKGTLEGTVSGNIEVIYYYKLKSAELIVKHLEYGTNKELTTPETKEVKYGEKYSTSKSSLITENYELFKKTENYEGIVTSDTIEVIYYYQKKDSSLETSIQQTVPSEITSKNQTNDYTITYTAKISDYIGAATITITEYLPYKIDQNKSDLDGGTYNSETNTITWIVTNEEIDSSNEPKNITITKNFKIVYSNIDSTKRSMSNTATGTIVLDNNQRAAEEQKVTYIKISGKIIVHHYIEGTKTKIIDDVETSNLVGETYISTAMEKDGYILKKEPSDKNHIYQDEPQEIIYEYERIKYSISTKVKGEGGNINGDEEVYYGEDSKNEIIIKPKDGYLVDQILINGEKIDTTKCNNGCTLPIFKNIKENKEIVVIFKKIPDNPPTSSIITIFTITGLIVLSSSSYILVKKFKPSIKKI